MDSNAKNKETTSNTSPPVRTYLKRLDIERETLESELSEIVSELTSGTNPIGIDTPLIDNEGYPRNDIDIYRARTLRKRYHEISNNLKDIMKKIEGGLIKISAVDTSKDDEEMKRRKAPKPKPKFDAVSGKWVVMNWDGSIAGDDTRKFEDIKNDNETQNSNQPQNSIPFAVIDSVASNSPASEAGLHEGDLIVKFGDATFSNHKNLSLVATIVSQAANEKSVQVTVLRRRRMNSIHDVTHDVEAAVRDTLVLDVMPRTWSGRGVLGCHIVLYNEVTECNYIEPC